MKKLIFFLIVSILAISNCTKIEDPVVITTKTWSAGGSGTKAVIDMKWEEADSVSIYSVNKEGVITYVDHVVISNISKDYEYCDITAKCDENALHYYGHFPARSCPLDVGDTYKPIYNEPSISSAPRLHDLPQIGQANGNTIHFQAQCSCFRISEIRKSKLPIIVKILDENQQVLYYKTITKDDDDLSNHFSRRSLFGFSDYYDYCWNIPFGKEYTIRVQVNPNTILQRQFENKQTGKRGTVYNFNIWGY